MPTCKQPRKLRTKIPQLQSALHGRVTEHHRFMLRTLMGHLEYLEGTIDELSARIKDLTHPFDDKIRKLSTIPGLERRSLENILVEIGTDMDRFPTHGQTASPSRSSGKGRSSTPHPRTPGFYSNKSRGMRAKAAGDPPRDDQAVPTPSAAWARRRWAVM